MIELVVTLRCWLSDRQAHIEEHGATSVEYALMVGLIAAVIAGAVRTYQMRVHTMFNNIANTLPL